MPGPAAAAASLFHTDVVKKEEAGPMKKNSSHCVVIFLWGHLFIGYILLLLMCTSIISHKLNLHLD